MTIFDPRSNSFGFLRLVLAVTVIVSHTWPLGGFGTDPGRPENNVGILAVEGFFALSGFLIAASGTRTTVGRFLWHRLLRIFPAYWIALLAVAGIFAPIVWHASHGLRDYPFASPSPIGYLVNNLLLGNLQVGIGDTLAANPYPTLWNGPLYTLSYEFSCYLLIALLMAGRLLGARLVGAMVAACWAWLQLIESGTLGAFDDRQAKFTLCFLVGALVYLLRDRLLTRSPWIPLLALVVSAVSYATVGFMQVGVPALAYLVIWAGTVLPLRGVGRRADISYGLYIYGWPMQQVAAHFGADRLGLIPYFAIVLAATAGLASASWFLVESRALARKNDDPFGWWRGGGARSPRVADG